MLGLGMASSHAPMMFQKAQYWPRVVGRIPAEAREQLPRSAREEVASPAIIEANIQRIEGGLATLREQLRAYRPDALLMIGDDQGDLFDDTNNGLYLDVNPINLGGGTSVTVTGCYSYDMNEYGYYMNNYAYSSFVSCAADSNNLNYWVHNSENITFLACGSEVSLGHSAVGYGIDGNWRNINIIGCYWTQIPFNDAVAVTATPWRSPITRGDP